MKRTTTIILIAILILSICSELNAYSDKWENTDKGGDFKSPIVYYTSNISADGLMDIFRELDRPVTYKVGVKISTGEPGGKNFLSPELVQKLVKAVNGTIVECNTAYYGKRKNTESHRKVAFDHGWTGIANVDILDADGEMILNVANGKHLKENRVGSHFKDYAFYVVLSHFKGHQSGGFGGAIKNMSIGLASSAGKSWIHSAGTATTGFGNASQDVFLESMAEAAKSVADAMGNNILYINVLNRLSVDCDCSTNPAEPDMHDIGILASLDPVALDKACIDLIYAASDGKSLINRIESRNGLHTLVYGEKIGLGSQFYQLISFTKAR
jgi:uncharacterized Fe-S center protein